MKKEEIKQWIKEHDDDILDYIHGISLRITLLGTGYIIGVCSTLKTLISNNC